MTFDLDIWHADSAWYWARPVSKQNRSALAYSA